MGHQVAWAHQERLICVATWCPVVRWIFKQTNIHDRPRRSGQKPFVTTIYKCSITVSKSGILFAPTAVVRIIDVLLLINS